MRNSSVRKITFVRCSVQTRYPTYVGDVAEVCLQLCDQRIKQVRHLILEDYPLDSPICFF